MKNQDGEHEIIGTEANYKCYSVPFLPQVRCKRTKILRMWRSSPSIWRHNKYNQSNIQSFHSSLLRSESESPKKRKAWRQPSESHGRQKRSEEAQLFLYIGTMAKRMRKTEFLKWQLFGQKCIAVFGLSHEDWHQPWSCLFSRKSPRKHAQCAEYWLKFASRSNEKERRLSIGDVGIDGREEKFHSSLRRIDSDYENTLDPKLQEHFMWLSTNRETHFSTSSTSSSSSATTPSTTWESSWQTWWKSGHIGSWEDHWKAGWRDQQWRQYQWRAVRIFLFFRSHRMAILVRAMENVHTTPHCTHIFSLPARTTQYRFFQWNNSMLHFRHLESDPGACTAAHFVGRCFMFGSRAVWAKDGAFIPSSRICVTLVSASFRKTACHRMTLLCDFHATTFCSTPPHSDTSLILIPDNENLVNDDTGWNATFHCRRYSARGCTGWLFGIHHPRHTHSWRVEDREHLQWPQPRRNIPYLSRLEECDVRIKACEARDI